MEAHKFTKRVLNKRNILYIGLILHTVDTTYVLKILRNIGGIWEFLKNFVCDLWLKVNVLENLSKTHQNLWLKFTNVKC